MADGIDEIARAGLVRAEADIHELRGDVKTCAAAIVTSDTRSAERHGVGQAQNAAMLAQLAAIDKRLNEPSALISLLGNKAAIGGAVSLIVALTGLAAAFGYGGAKAGEAVAPVAISQPAPPERDVAP